MECKILKWDRKEENGRYFCEKICLNQYTNFKNIIDNKWLKHICNEIGCFNRMVICDGNEKLYRYCCSLPIIKTNAEKGEINITQRCVNNPTRGNQHLPTQKLCHYHATGKSSAVTSTEQIDLRPITRSLTRDLPEKILSGQGCKAENNLNKYSERTAGMFYMLRSCGICHITKCLLLRA